MMAGSWGGWKERGGVLGDIRFSLEISEDFAPVQRFEPP